MENRTFFQRANKPNNSGLLMDANAVVQVGSLECYDKMVFFLKITDDTVQDIRFLIEGCETTVATSSAVTELAMGKSLDTLLEISEQTIADALSDFSGEEMHCPAMAASAMQSVAQLYRDTPKGEASSVTQALDHCNIAIQILNRPLSESYSSDYDL